MLPKWRMLAVLFTARVAMAFQFQSVAALSASYQTTYGVGLDSIGFLIGLYLSPGLLLAMPSGLIGAILGGKRGVSLGLALMVLGAVMAAFAGSWGTEIAGRLVMGAGGVLMNVVMTKMVTDWFAKADLATAMALFVNSWPIGIAAALVILPGLGAWAAWFLVGLCAIAMLIFVAYYHDPPDLKDVAPGPVFSLPGDSKVLIGIFAAGGIWGFLNAGLAVVFSFGPDLLIEQGFSPEAAAWRTSLVLWSMALTIPFGGLFADRTGRHDLVVVASITAFTVLMAITPFAGGSWVVFALTGALGGLCAGPVMSLPAGVLPPSWRAQGMGVFFTIYYLVMTIGPPLAGWVSEVLATATGAFWVGVGFLVICLPMQAVVRRCRL